MKFSIPFTILCFEERRSLVFVIGTLSVFLLLSVFAVVGALVSPCPSVDSLSDESTEPQVKVEQSKKSCAVTRRKAMKRQRRRQTLAELPLQGEAIFPFHLHLLWFVKPLFPAGPALSRKNVNVSAAFTAAAPSTAGSRSTTSTPSTSSSICCGSDSIDGGSGSDSWKIVVSRRSNKARRDGVNEASFAFSCSSLRESTSPRKRRLISKIEQEKKLVNKLQGVSNKKASASASLPQPVDNGVVKNRIDFRSKVVGSNRSVLKTSVSCVEAPPRNENFRSWKLVVTNGVAKADDSGDNPAVSVTCGDHPVTLQQQ